MTRPKITREEAIKLIDSFNLKLQEKVKFLGIRGYYKDTMGKPGENDRGIYDDAICIISPAGFITFNGNTDPSTYRTGMAVLKTPQVIWYKRGIHGISGSHPHAAWRQDSNVSVTRDGKGEFTDTPQTRFWTNLHSGGHFNTGSAGCQTIIKDQWQEFQLLGYKVQDQYKQERVPYFLIEL